MIHKKINVKFYVASIVFFLGVTILFFYLRLNGFYIHVSLVENLIPEEDEPLILVLFLVGTAIFELAIYCLDSEIYAQKQRLANLRKQKLLYEYVNIIAFKDKQQQLLFKQLEQLRQLKIDNAKDLCVVSEEAILKERNLKASILQLQSSVHEITVQCEELEKKTIHFVARNYNNNFASLNRTDICVQLHENAKSNMKAGRQQIIELESEIDSLYPGFSKNLYGFFPKLSDRQRSLCLLMKAGFTTLEIASLLCLHYSSVSHMKSRLFKSLEVDGVTDLNDFLTKL